MEEFDLVAKLRAAHQAPFSTEHDHRQLLLLAANEIERLRSNVGRELMNRYGGEFRESVQEQMTELVGKMFAAEEEAAKFRPADG